MKRRPQLLLTSLIILAIGQSAAGQSTATKFRIKDAEAVVGGELYITTGGRERKVYDRALAAWIINDGHDVVFSGPDGSGGFENEGQSLRIYNVQTRATRKILAEYVAVVALKAVRTSSGALALLVRLEDGGLGGSYFAVVDPHRGEVFFRRWAELKRIEGDRLTLALYREEDFDKINEERDSAVQSPDEVISTTRIPPYKTEQHDLRQILQNRVIYNRPTSPESGNETAAPKNVKIFLWDVNSKQGSFGLTPVMRRVYTPAPPRATLQMLFAGATDEEKAKGLSSSTFGMRFEDVKLQTGRALIKVSQPPDQTNYGSQGPMIFQAALEKTARQFPAVKKVEVCAVGKTLIDAELAQPFPKCK